MHREIQVETPVGRQQLVAVLADLCTYSEWLDVVHDAQPAPPIAGDLGPAWHVTLRAQIGRLARSKRLRVVRTVTAEDRVRFDRSEDDDRTHAAWVMEAVVHDRPSGSVANLTLHYDGGLWSTVLDTILGDQVGSASVRLRSYLDSHQ